MFTRSELEVKTIPELNRLCQRYGIKPSGNRVYKTSYITSLMASRLLLSRSSTAVTPLCIGTWVWGDKLFWSYGDRYGYNLNICC